MSFDKLKNPKLDKPESKEAREKRMAEAREKEIDRCFASLEKPEITAEDVWNLIDNLGANNPKVKDAFSSFQKEQWEALKQKLRECNEMVREDTFDVNEVLIAHSEYQTLLPEDLVRAIVASDLNEDRLLQYFAWNAYKLNNEARNSKLKDFSHLRLHWNFPGGEQKTLEDRGYDFMSDRDFLDSQKWKVEALEKFLNTDRGQNILENSQIFYFRKWISDSIENSLWFEEISERETEITNKLLLKTDELILKISQISETMTSRIHEIKEQKTTSIKAWGLESTYQNAISEMPSQIENEIKEVMKVKWKEIWEYLLWVEPRLSVVTLWGKFKLPFWGDKITLDFSKLWDVSNLDNKELLAKFNENFDEIYRDDIWEIISDSVSKAWEHVKENPLRTWVDFGSVLLSWILTALAAKTTWWSSLPASALVFTASDNFIRAVWYEAIWQSEWKKLWEWALEGLGISKNDILSDIVRKKSLELASNALLLKMFQLTQNSMKNLDFSQKIAATPALIWWEALFFTWYIQLLSWADKSLKMASEDWITIEEIWNNFVEELNKLTNLEDFMDLYVYNTMFITSVRWGIKIGELTAPVLISKLKNLWYNLEASSNWRPVIYWPNWEKASMSDPKIKELTKKVAEDTKSIITNTQSTKPKPETWRGWKVASESSLADKKYKRLEKFSNEAKEEWISYAMRDSSVYGEVWNSGFWRSWENVSAWLLKKAWFEPWEVKAFREGKLKPETEPWKRAMEKMREASERILKEYSDFIENVDNLPYLRRYDKKTLVKLIRIYEKWRVTIQ